MLLHLIKISHRKKTKCVFGFNNLMIGVTFFREMFVAAILNERAKCLSLDPLICIFFV